MLKMNNFPEIVVIELMNTYYTLMRPTKTGREKQNTQYMAIPSISGINTINKRSLGKLTTAKVITKPDRTNSMMISKNKDKTEIEERTNTIIIAECNCKKKELLERTNYKERTKLAIERLKKKIGNSEEHCTEETHQWSHQKIRAINGGNTYAEFKERSQIIAYRKRGSTVKCTWELPHRRMRRHID